MSPIILIASLITAFVITYFVIPVIIKVSFKRNIFDSPGKRKVHKVEKPSMGGIAMFIGLCLSLLIWLPWQGIVEFKYILGAMILMVIIGIRDDLIPLKPIVKLLGQFVAALMVIYLFELRVSSFYGLFGDFPLPDAIAILITLFVIIVITNSYNLIDGLDGLASSVALVALISFGVWFYLVGHQEFNQLIAGNNYQIGDPLPDALMICVIIAAFIGAIAAFLRFNWEPSKIFMGDTGALLIGFSLSFLAIYFLDINAKLPVGNPYKTESPIATAMCVLVVPLFDTLRIFIVRISKGQSPFSPDKGHVHHVLARIGYNHAQSSLVLASANIVFVGIAILFSPLEDIIALPILVILFVSTGFLLSFILKRKMRR